MAGVTRRGLLSTAAGAGTAAAAGVLLSGTTARAEAGTAAPPDAVTVGPADRRYLDLTSRCYNARFVGTPDTVRIVHSTRQVVAAVQEAVDTGRRLAVRSGGHCLEDLVDNPEVRLLIDVSEMSAVGFDPERGAFCVEAGATLGHVYRALYLDWGVTVPGGTCPTVGVGGHVTGGGYGAMCRKYGAIVDHLYGVEVVTVDAAGRARAVVATRDDTGSLGDLWWAHTGGGGGTYGIVTRFWFRSPEATGGSPAALLPTPPRRLLQTSVTWRWADLTARDFAALVRNHGAWHEEHSTHGSRYDSQHSLLTLRNAAQGTVTLSVQTDADLADADRLTGDYVAAVSSGVTAGATTQSAVWPWMRTTLRDLYDTGTHNRTKSKGAYLRRGWSDEQVAALYDHLGDPGYDGQAGILLYSYGGKVNTVAPDGTAMPQRDSVLKANFTTYWADPSQDDRHLAWLRSLYHDMYAATGGVPALDGAADGSYINYPDTDLADPALNTSGIPWQSLYFKDNLPRLRRAKAAWDPGNVFRHALSVTA
ncbi:FAD-binding oxidoreductase [Streptomyces sp. NRRL S-813]|uniref:FAD-binding oxidoreductase n=1 Tax=Streptomyces sp. NRRL S-813 TaxID=1463919 RepID=UPI0004BFFC02|nr:FAD-binding protein [Streptomyces sp. NRRL S-813]